MEPIKYFDMADVVEPKCPGCHHIVHYGTDSKYSEEAEAHVCVHCGSTI